MKVLDINNRGRGFNDGGRMNGKTFQRLFYSLAQASEGHHVHYIVEDAQQQRWMSKLVRDIVHVYFGERLDTTGNVDSRNIVRFPNNGFVRLVTLNEWNHRPVPTGVFSTHNVIEMDDNHK
jgi:hypothetical protein